MRRRAELCRAELRRVVPKERLDSEVVAGLERDRRLPLRERRHLAGVDDVQLLEYRIVLLLQSKQYERLLRKPCQIMCIKSEVVVLLKWL